MKKILFHACCAPCSSIIIDWVEDQPFLSGAFYFFNPYIHPYVEFELRLKSFESFMEKKRLGFYIDGTYDIESVIGHNSFGLSRCEQCYKRRLEATADQARKEGYSSFSTTLLVSPYQNHDLIIRLGQEAAKKYSVDFFYHDFRSLFHNGKKNAIKQKLYRQQYCGCIFSEYERFSAEKKQKGSIKQVTRILQKIEDGSNNA